MPGMSLAFLMVRTWLLLLTLSMILPSAIFAQKSDSVKLSTYNPTSGRPTKNGGSPPQTEYNFAKLIQDSSATSV